jgi:hypothetical protein
MESGIHEDLRRGKLSKVSSDRSFGLVFTAFFAILAVWPLLRSKPLRPWALAVSGVFLLLALVAPGLLHPLNTLWARLGLLFSKITNPIITGLMFYLVFMPTGYLFRLLGKDLLRLKFDPDAETYWISRQPPGPPPQTMTNQF